MVEDKDPSDSHIVPHLPKEALLLFFIFSVLILVDLLIDIIHLFSKAFFS